MAEITAAEIIVKINALEASIETLTDTPSSLSDVEELDVKVKKSQQLAGLLKTLDYWQKRLESIPTFETSYMVDDGRHVH